MSVAFHTRVDGAKELDARLRGAKWRVWPALKVELEVIGAELALRMKTAAPRGKTRGGRLQRSIFHKLTERGDVLIERIGPSRRAYYGRFVETGVNRAGIKVKGFYRRTGAIKGMGESRNRTTGEVSLRKKTVAIGVAFVRPYERAMRMAARPFVRPSYESVAPGVPDRLVAAVDRRV